MTSAPMTPWDETVLLAARAFARTHEEPCPQLPQLGPCIISDRTPSHDYALLQRVLKRSTARASRVIVAWVHGVPYDNLDTDTQQAHHLCERPSCISPLHVVAGTRSQNAVHALTGYHPAVPQTAHSPISAPHSTETPTRTPASPEPPTAAR